MATRIEREGELRTSGEGGRGRKGGRRRSKRWMGKERREVGEWGGWKGRGAKNK